MSSDFVKSQANSQAGRLKARPYTQHPTPHTLHSTPYTLHPSPYTLNPKPFSLSLSLAGWTAGGTPPTPDTCSTTSRAPPFCTRKAEPARFERFKTVTTFYYRPSVPLSLVLAGWTSGAHSLLYQELETARFYFVQQLCKVQSDLQAGRRALHKPRAPARRHRVHPLFVPGNPNRCV